MLPFVGIVCGCIGVVRHAPRLPRRGGAPSPGAEKEARILSDYEVDPPPKPEVRITDI